MISWNRSGGHRAAAALGLASGRIAKGALADLVLCDLNAPVVIDADKLVSKSRVLRTIVDGRTVYSA